MTDGPSLKISVDSSGAKSGSDQAVQSFEKVKKKASELNDAIDKVDTSLDETKQSMDNVASSANSATGPVAKLSGGVLANALAADKLAVANARAALSSAKLAGDKVAISAAKQALAVAQAGEATNKASKALEDFNNKIHPTSPLVDRVRDSFGRMANGIAIIDGPLGGIASRITAFNSLLGRVTPNMLGFAITTAAIGFAVKKSLDAFVPYEAAMAKLNATLEVTGRSSQLTADQVDALAQNLDGFKASRTEVLDTVAAIASFENIKTDKIEDIVKIANDLSVVFGGSLQQQAQKVARALNEPGEAFALLGRQGLNFTKQEQEVLRLLQETGQTAKAQGILFTEFTHIHDIAARQAGTTAKKLDDLGDNLEDLGIKLAKDTGFVDGFNVVIKALTTSVEYLAKSIAVVGTGFSKLADIAIIAGARVGLLDQEVIKLAKDHFYGNEDAKAIEKIGKAADGTTTDVKKTNEALKDGVKNLEELRKQAERVKNGGLTDAGKAFRDELKKMGDDSAFKVQSFGLEGSDLELAKFRQKINENQEAFKELGYSGREAVKGIEADIVRLGDLQKKQAMTKPIDDYVKAAEFNFKKVNEIIVRSGETFLDALTDPYKEGETAAQRWKGVVASILRDIAKEIIRTQVIAGAVKFTSGLFASSFGGAPAGASGGAAPKASAMGNAFQNGRIIPHAQGGVVDRFSAFPMAGGNVGTIAEGNKAEGILPLKRNSQGQLGVIAQGSSSSGGNFYNSTTVHVDGSSGGDAKSNQELGKTVAKAVDARVEQIVAKFYIKQAKTGGVFNGARA